MKRYISVISLVCVFVMSAQPVCASVVRLVAHDQILLKNSTTILTATVVDEKTLRDVEIIPGGRSPAFTSLTISEIKFQIGQVGGLEVLVANIDRSKFAVDLPPGSTYKPDFSVVLKMGTKWFESLSRGSNANAELSFYPNEAGGLSRSYSPDLICELLF